MRGEYDGITYSPDSGGELPPRARRILVFKDDSQVCVGTTSACAENTSAEKFEETLDRNYLRVRGEYLLVVSSLSALSELPPRARRIQHLTKHETYSIGTTSACAENTLGSVTAPARHRNYLRVRGEYVSKWK